MARISVQNFHLKSEIQATISHLSNLYDVMVPKDYKGEMVNVSVAPSKAEVGKKYLVDNEHGIWQCRVNDHKWWHVGLALRDVGLKLIDLQDKSVSPELKLSNDAKVVKPLNVMDLLREEWIDWTKACDKKFENVTLSEENLKKFKNITKNMGSVEAEFQELRYTRRRYERSEKQGQRNQLVFSKVSTIDLFKNKIYHLQCLQAWSDIQTGNCQRKKY